MILPSIRARIVTAGFACGGLLASCTPTASRMPPYRHDPVAQKRLERRAAGICACLRGGDDLPPHPFTTDGCSMSPDGDWASCCVEHDIAYWCGGSRADRRHADLRLRDCVAAKGHSRVFAGFVRGTVRVGGVSCSPFPWRWGYGWPAPAGYRKGPAAGDRGDCFAKEDE